MPRSKKRGRRVQSTQDMYTCNHCDYMARGLKGIKLHLRESHKIYKDVVDEDDYRCENCGKVFKTDEMLITHIRKDHRC